MGNYVTTLTLNDYDRSKLEEICQPYGITFKVPLFYRNQMQFVSSAWIPSIEHVNKHKALCYDLQQAGYKLSNVDIYYAPYFL